MSIDTKGIAKADLLVALFNAATPGALHGGYGDAPMDRAQAENYLEETHYFTYVDGRALFVDLSIDALDVSLYNMNNGRGRAELALAPLLVLAAERENRSDARDRQMVGQVLSRARQMS